MDFKGSGPEPPVRTFATLARRSMRPGTETEASTIFIQPCARKAAWPVPGNLVGSDAPGHKQKIRPGQTGRKSRPRGQS